MINDWIKCSERLPRTTKPSENTLFETSKKVWIVYTKKGLEKYFYSTATLFMYDTLKWKIDDIDPWSEVNEVVAWINLPENYEEIRN